MIHGQTRLRPRRPAATPAVPRISVVISTFNSAPTLQACLDSIHAQTYDEIEIVVADGASTDGTVALLEANEDRLGAWFSAPDRGIYDAWNKALAHVTGDWVYFIGGDDTLYGPRVMEEVVDRLDAAPEGTLIAYGQIHYVGADGTVTVMGAPWEVAGPGMRSQMTLPHQGVFHARALFDAFGGFDEEFQIAGDYKLVMQSLARAAPFYLGEVIVANQGAGGKSSLRRNRVAALGEFRRVQAMLGYRVTPAWLVAYAKGWVWKLLDRIGVRT